MSDFRILAHRVVLYTANQYFETMFANASKEGDQWKISIKDVSGDILQQLIQNCYTAEIAIDSKCVEKMMSAAATLKFTEVHKHCTTFLSKNLNASNCLRIRENADKHKMVQLKERAHDFALDHFIELSNSTEFLQLSVDRLMELLKDDRINIAAEEDVFTAVMEWVKYNVATRKKLLQSLLGCVRFQHFQDPVSMKSPITLRNLSI